MFEFSSSEIKIAVIGLGYVGLPLASEFGKVFDVLGFDKNIKRIRELNDGFDRTSEIAPEQIKNASKLKFTSKTEDLRSCNVYIIAVPTPIDVHNIPNINLLLEASKTVGEVLKKNDVVIFESTVYPGCTEEDCVPVIERYSKLKLNIDFFCGYSPERINPGDKKNTLISIVKVTSGSTKETSEFVDWLYKKIIVAGTHKASSIKTAEAAKVIENIQRDLNIALMNELNVLFNKLDLDVQEILDAAKTKWNFIPFQPGFVGGHCIGVDPYYLTHKAKEVGHDPQVILAGRKINDSMAEYAVSRLTKKLVRDGIALDEKKILLLGISFKENCGDVRNSKIFDIQRQLLDLNFQVDVYDPHVNIDDLPAGTSLVTKRDLSFRKFDIVVLAVRHDEFIQQGSNWPRSLCKPGTGLVYDLVSVLPKEKSDLRL